MMSGINNNASYSIANYMQAFGVDVSKSLEKLSTGLKIPSPSYNAGAYFVASSLDRRASQTTEIANALSDRIEGLRSARDTLNEAKALLEEAASLAFKASNEDSQGIRENYGIEYDEILSTVDKLIDNFTFNGTNLLIETDGDNDGETAFSAIVEEDTVDAQFTYSLYESAVDDAHGLDLGSYWDAENEWEDAATGKADAATYYAEVYTNADSGIKRLERNVDRISNTLTFLEGRQTSLLNKAENYQAASQSLVGIDSGKEATTLAANQIMQQASAFFLAQANTNNANVTKLIFGFGS